MTESGVWRTIGGRRVFIKDGQSLADAMKESGKFPGGKKVDKQREIRHNDRDNWLLDGYEKAVRNGDINALTGFDVYRRMADEVEARLVGVTASNGLLVNGYKTHFIDRLIGQHAADDVPHVGMRRGVTVDEALEALTGEYSASARKDGRKSVKFNGQNCDVTINPDTGHLIQTNPRR